MFPPAFQAARKAAFDKGDIMTVQSPPGSAPPPPTQPAPPPAKKGLGPVGWIAIGCGVIVILIVAGLAVTGFFVKRMADKVAKNPAMVGAEILVRANPDLELVSKDENAQTITIRNKKTNEVITANLEDIKGGRLKFSSDKGSASVDIGGKDGAGTIKVTDEKGKESTLKFGAGAPQELPGWVPSYPGATVQGSYAASNTEGRAGGFTVSTGDTVQKMTDFYEAQLKAAGFKTQKATFAAAGAYSGATLNATSADEKRSVNIAISAGDKGGAQAVVTFNEKT
jgi:hypothetical protein